MSREFGEGEKLRGWQQMECGGIQDTRAEVPADLQGSPGGTQGWFLSVLHPTPPFLFFPPLPLLLPTWPITFPFLSPTSASSSPFFVFVGRSASNFVFLRNSIC